MNKTTLSGFKLIGIKLPHKTTNEGGQSGIDCGALWQKFELENFSGRVPDKLGEEVFAVYFDYEGDHTQPYSYFIGCRTMEDAVAPEGMDTVLIPADEYCQFTVKGVMPDCVADGWRSIWNSSFDRTYHFDFERYDERSKHWSDAEVEIFISLR